MSFESFNSLKINLVIDLNKTSLVTKAPSYAHRSSSRVQWTSEENEKIINHVKRFGPKKWKEIAAEIKTKNAQQCRDHYNDVLDPNIKNAIWTKEEEKILLLKYEQLGPHWSKIKAFLPGRTTGMIKNYVNILLNKGVYNEEHKKHFNTEFTNDIEEKNKQFSYHDIEFLLNHPSNFQFNL
ncbi:Myb- protein A [Tritrichomonas musculus]|uniref:Myb- protein A n=1 Tax=Tritrichomonas musculus TaxID=1915356 RepID=A0ABR2INT4_9EUKA